VGSGGVGGMWRALKPAPALGGALPNDLKKELTTNSTEESEPFLWREDRAKKLAPSGSSHTPSIASRGAVLPNDLLKNTDSYKNCS
jgi:hypothetical protein